MSWQWAAVAGHAASCMRRERISPSFRFYQGISPSFRFYQGVSPSFRLYQGVSPSLHAESLRWGMCKVLEEDVSLLRTKKKTEGQNQKQWRAPPARCNSCHNFSEPTHWFQRCDKISAMRHVQSFGGRYVDFNSHWAWSFDHLPLSLEFCTCSYTTSSYHRLPCWKISRLVAAVTSARSDHAHHEWRHVAMGTGWSKCSQAPVPTGWISGLLVRSTGRYAFGDLQTDSLRSVFAMGVAQLTRSRNKYGAVPPLCKSWLFFQSAETLTINF
jgi:hypothetical protein